MQLSKQCILFCFLHFSIFFFKDICHYFSSINLPLSLLHFIAIYNFLTAIACLQQGHRIQLQVLLQQLTSQPTYISLHIFINFSANLECIVTSIPRRFTSLIFETTTAHICSLMYLLFIRLFRFSTFIVCSNYALILTFSRSESTLLEMQMTILRFVECFNTVLGQ